MAHDSKYGKHEAYDCKGTEVTVNVDSLSDLPPGASLSLEEQAKQKMSNQGKHKGTFLYTKYDK